MEFFVYETGETIKARQRPIVIITSNNEKELPDAFLRRCFFHYIKFPERETMQAIIDVHFPGLKGRLVHEALNIFYDIREVQGLKKKPSTSELLDWTMLLLNEDGTPDTLRDPDPRKLIPPLHGALLKNDQDVSLVEKLAVMAMRARGWTRAQNDGCRETLRINRAQLPRAIAGRRQRAVCSSLPTNHRHSSSRHRDVVPGGAMDRSACRS